MNKLLTCMGVFTVIFACHALPTLAVTTIEINHASYSQDTTILTIAGVNFDAYGTPLISIGDTPLFDSCSILSTSMIECDITTTPAINGGNFPVKISAGNAPHVNARIDVYIPPPNQVFQCNPGDMVTCYSDIPTTINVGECLSGYRICGDDSEWSECQGAVTPVDELCDGLDNDCDDDIDEDATDAQIYYQDNDGDGFGATNNALTACEMPAGYETVDGDCDDTSQNVYPGGTEYCNNEIDDNCNNQIDEYGCVDLPDPDLPVVGSTGTDGVLSGDQWVVCSVDTDTLWLSSYHTGVYNALVTCNSLGYSNVSAFGGTCGTVCGYCGTSGWQHFDGGGGSVTDLRYTVHWLCTK